jgi:RNA polymerase sigma factor (sigma-70 family)
MRVTVIDSTARGATDSVLIARCLDGDDAAWHALIGRHGRLVEAVIRRYHLPTDDHADVFQDVWVALWRDLASVRDHERLGPWLVTTAGRIAWDTRKRLARDAKNASVDADPDSNVVVDAADLPEQAYLRRETAERVRAALARISPRSRRLLEALFFEDDLSYVEVAARLGCSPNSIGPIRQRCFKELRDALVAR